MTVREQHYRRFSPTTAGWWVRLLVAGVFAFYLNYVPSISPRRRIWMAS